MMNNQLHVSIIYNEPTIATEEGRKYVSATGIVNTDGSFEKAHEAGLLDMSEVGVLEQKEDIESALKVLGYRTTIFNVTNDIDGFIDPPATEEPEMEETASDGKQPDLPF